MIYKIDNISNCYNCLNQKICWNEIKIRRRTLDAVLNKISEIQIYLEDKIEQIVFE